MHRSKYTFAISSVIIFALNMGCTKPDKGFGQFPETNQTKAIKALIDELENLDRRQFIFPGDIQLIGPDNSKIEFPEGFPEEQKSRFFRERNTAEKLYDIGPPAVPHLIERLEDKTKTRCIHAFRSGIGEEAMTIGQVCQHILDELLGAPPQKDIPQDRETRQKYLTKYYRQRSSLTMKIGEP